MSSASSNNIVLTIDELAGGGDGVGRFEDRAVFVSDTAPGDRVRVQVRERRRRWWRATLLEVLEPGPGRRDPACPLSLVCGGCQWHHIQIDHQLAAKGGLLERAFRQARVDAPAAELLPAPDPLGYRCRARLRWHRHRNAAPFLGFLGRRSHRVVDLTACPVLLPNLSALLPDLRAALTKASLSTGGEVHLLGNERGQQAVALHPISDPATAAALGKTLAPALQGVRTHPNADKRTGRSGRPTTWGSVEIDQAREGERPFWTTPETFFQANPAVNRRLCDLVAARASGDDGDGNGRGTGTEMGTWVELFAGSGNLTRGLAQRCEGIAVESQPEAAALARRNLSGLDVQWRTDDARQATDYLSTRELSPELVVLDPPRTGARDLLDSLARLRPRRILYVSCDPMTLARDVAHLARAGYLLARITVLDTMPQTYHFETVAELRLA
jgi:23S rRNA (uracil1939-C5)-methyltransferase